MNYKLTLIFYYIKYKFFMKFKSKRSLEKYQQKKIDKHLKYITEKSKFYKDYRGKKIEEFPIVNKKIMMENFDEINTVAINKEKAFEIAFLCEKDRDFTRKYNDITVGLSSGTSGNRGLFVATDFEKAKWAGIILAKLLPRYIFQKQKIALFLRSDSPLYNTVKSKVISFNFFDMLLNHEENIEKLNRYKPDVLIAPASVLKIIASNVEKLDINPLKVFSCAEVLTDGDREFIREKLKINIENIYQATEGFIGYSTDEIIRINEDFVYVEKEYIDAEKTRFIPIITDFERTSQPIIRYRLDDVWIEDKERPGEVFLTLKNIEGREDDIFMFLDKESKEVRIFSDFIRKVIMMSSNDIYEYRVIQKGLRNIEVSFLIETSVVSKDNELEIENIQNKILGNFKDLLDGYNISYDEIDIKFTEYMWKDRLAKNKRIIRAFK